jgi:hypothetical protein
MGYVAEDNSGRPKGLAQSLVLAVPVNNSVITDLCTPTCVARLGLASQRPSLCLACE